MNGGYDENTLRSLGEGLSPARLVGMLSLLQKTSSELSRSTNQRTDAELCLLRLSDPALDGSITGLIARVERLENAVAGIPMPLSMAEPSVSVMAPAAAPRKPAPKAEPASAAPTVEDRPPWEEPTAPVEVKPAPAPKSQKTEPKPAPQPPKSIPAAPAGNLWPGLVAGLRGKIGFAEYPFLSNPAMVQGVLEGEKLTLWVDSDMTRMLLNKPAVLDTVAAAATARVGHPLRVAVQVGKAPVMQASPAPAPPVEAEDALDALLADSEQFDNIFVTE